MDYTGVNFINILQAAIDPIFLRLKITKPNRTQRKAVLKTFIERGQSKMSMKLIIGTDACIVTLTLNEFIYIYVCGVGDTSQNCDRFNVGTGTWDTTITITLPNSCYECTCVVNPTNRNQIIISQGV